MSIDASDLVDSALNEQARRNAAFIDQPGVNDLISDFVTIGPPNPETIGMQADVVGTVATTTPHLWDDNQTAWNFWSWDT